MRSSLPHRKSEGKEDQERSGRSGTGQTEEEDRAKRSQPNPERESAHRLPLTSDKEEDTMLQFSYKLKVAERVATTPSVTGDARPASPLMTSTRHA